MHERHYFPGRLWIVTAQPENLKTALWDCDIVRKPRRILANEASPTEFLAWTPECLPKAGQWVRAKRGLYKGDLAFVLGNSSSTDVLQIAVVPRLLSVPLPQTKKKAPDATHPEKKRKVSIRSSRPAPSLFDPLVAEMQNNAQTRKKGQNAAHNSIEKLERTIDGPSSTRIKHTHPDGTLRSPHEGEIPQQFCYRYNKVNYIGGLLIKYLCGSECELERSPLPHELLPFVDSKIWPDIILPLFVSLHWKEGDKVIAHGETGTIASTEPQTALVRLDSDQNGPCIVVDIVELDRRWNTGDSVKVIAGPNIGKQGIVVMVEADPPYIHFLEQDSLASVRFFPPRRLLILTTFHSIDPRSS